MDRKLLVKGAAIFVGLLLAAFTQLIAFILGWGGEGWNAPFFCSPLLFFVYPIVFVRMADRQGTSIGVEAALLAVAALADVFLVAESWLNEYRYFSRVMEVGAPFTHVWIALWALWQVLAAVTIGTRIGRRDETREETAELG
jgi:hypothetical protein